MGWWLLRLTVILISFRNGYNVTEINFRCFQLPLLQTYLRS